MFFLTSEYYPAYVSGMLERKAIRLRLYPDAEQETLFRKTGGCVRLVKNLAREQRRAFSRPGRSIGYYAQRTELAGLKAAAPFLREVPHHCLQEALVDLDRAFARFFAGQAAYPQPQKSATARPSGFPTPNSSGSRVTPPPRRTNSASAPTARSCCTCPRRGRCRR
jgi:hypothetical protein